jgi:hypothetical protein
MDKPMEPMEVGQRVRVTNRRLVHVGQRGTVVSKDVDGVYVHLDYDTDRPDARTFFHVEELEPIARVKPQVDRATDGIKP